MWLSFAGSVAVLLACLYAPGFLFFKALRSRAVTSFACAPLYSIVGYGLMGIVYSYAGIPATALGVVAPVFCVALALFAVVHVRRFVSRKTDEGLHVGEGAAQHAAGQGRFRRWVVRNFDPAALALYVFVGAAVSTMVFVASLNGANSFVPTYDNVHHYNLARSFADSGNWSVLHTSVYPGGEEQSWAPFPGGFYYPAGWHLLCAIAVSACSVPVAVAANALNFLVAAVIFPSGMCMLMMRVFPDNRKVVLAGAVFSSAFCMFPTVLLDVWPLYPNALSLALTPQFAACFMLACGDNVALRMRVQGVVGFVLGIATSVFTQPNAVFTAALLLIPFLVWRCGSIAGRRVEKSPRKALVMACAGAGAFVACMAIWAVCFKLPFLQSLVQYYWAPAQSMGQAAKSVVGLGFIGSNAQLLLAALVAVGAVGTLFVRRYLWTSCAYAFACVIYFVAASFGDVFLKHFLAGFWYTDAYRVGAIAAVLAVPVASFGFYLVVCGIAHVVRKAGRATPKWLPAAVSAVALVAFSVVNFSFTKIPGVESSGYSAFGAAYATGEQFNNAASSWVYDEEELSFVDEVARTVPEGSVVLNQPFDGSLLAYGINGLNTYYRSIAGYGTPAEPPESVILRTSVDEASSNEEVREALRRTGAKYLVVLDHSEADLERPYPGTYDPRKWEGINSVTDSTPGFSVELAKGEMRLYRIDAVA